MLITFHSKAYGDITMFGDVAKKLIKLMGHSGTVPSAILSEDVPQALSRLKAGVERARGQQPNGAAPPGAGDADEPPISLATRAFPLIEMLEAAADQECDVMWSSN
jgi:hypothetical protein